MFSYVDLVRMEIALDAEEQFAVTIADAETDNWQTLGDLARLVANLSEGRATEAEVVDWVLALLARVYEGSTEFAPEDDVFSNYDQVTGWFFARGRVRHPNGPDIEAPQTPPAT